MLETTVVIIGGGATGTGTLRDLSMRGIPSILLEQGSLAHGTSSRFHGLLHSGGRYAVSDPESARECITENTILRQIGRQCVEAKDGLFVLLPEDDPSFADKWLEACQKAGITATEQDLQQLHATEPELSSQIVRAFRVPDACIDGFRLVTHNVMSAQRFGGQVLVHHKVQEIKSKYGKIQSVIALNTLNGEKVEIACQCIINAGGSWAGQIAALAGLDVTISPDKGSLIVFNRLFTSHVVNRLHVAGDADIFVPHGTVTILGTTSVPVQDPAETSTTRKEIEKLLELGEKIFPQLRNYRILRTFAGTRPLYTPGKAQGRGASRNFHVVNHGEEEGLEGMFSIFGGKLTTYRLMAERVSDAVCAWLHINKPCLTACEPMIPDPDPEKLQKYVRYFPLTDLNLMANRLGDDLDTVLQASTKEAPNTNTLLCECEMVSRTEIETIAKEETTHSLNDIRLRTRMGMGTCQGTFCTLRTLADLYEHDLHKNMRPTEAACRFLQERWRGLRTVLWGTQTKEMLLNRAIYMGLLNVDGAIHEQNT